MTLKSKTLDELVSRATLPVEPVHWKEKWVRLEDHQQEIKRKDKTIEDQQKGLVNDGLFIKSLKKEVEVLKKRLFDAINNSAKIESEYKGEVEDAQQEIDKQINPRDICDYPYKENCKKEWCTKGCSNLNLNTLRNAKKNREIVEEQKDEVEGLKKQLKQQKGKYKKIQQDYHDSLHKGVELVKIVGGVREHLQNNSKTKSELNKLYSNVAVNASYHEYLKLKKSKWVSKEGLEGILKK